jgi:MinD-like ATPase involved in chromosome partitioning or flagellar assembly
MNSIGDVKAALEAAALQHGASIETDFIIPSVHIDVMCDEFTNIADIDRIQLIQSWLDKTTKQSKIVIEEVCSRLPLVINALTRSEAVERKSWTSHISKATWASSFLENTSEPRTDKDDYDGPPITHFYGYKGGQGRSTVLALLAKALADDGHRVLVVDADVEAPSLDAMFGITADLYSQTLMGLCGWDDNLQPIAAYAGKYDGRVDLIPCRPRSENADLDFAVLAATSPLTPATFESAASLLRLFIKSDHSDYDVVLIDHRTGIASSVIPIAKNLPGTAVVFARPDPNLSVLPSELVKVIRALLRETASVPGAFMSFSLDPNRTSANTPKNEARIRESLLNELADAYASRAEAGSSSASDVSLNWIEWYLDRALMTTTLPDVDQLFIDNRRTLNRLRETLALPIGRKAVQQPSTADFFSGAGKSYLSGARDLGPFLHIPEVDKLFVAGNTLTYILGRKGTGKTRLLREMAKQSFGIPLLVANDELETIGLKSQSPEAEEWLTACDFDAKTFWWSLLSIRLTNIDHLDKGMDELIRTSLDKKVNPRILARQIDLKKNIASFSSNRVFLVDGLETLVPAALIKNFVGSLFEMMGTLQNDVVMSSRVTVRSFIREDLAADSIQNIEQQLEGRSLRLKWSAASILNFALSRLPSLDWIGKRYKNVCDEIKANQGEIKRSALSEIQATELLLKVFPSRLRRNNLSTATFLRLYFSDTGGDDTSKGTFYPRLYLSFLQKLDTLAASASVPLDSDERIDSALLNRAYDEASNEFISETKQELIHLLALEYNSKSRPEDDETDATKVSKFISAFAGLSTPFIHDEIVRELVLKTNFTEKSVRESLQRMKAIRMFEERPGYAGWWRVGQLYKMGLMMKYVRG